MHACHSLDSETPHQLLGLTHTHIAYDWRECMQSHRLDYSNIGTYTPAIYRRLSFAFASPQTSPHNDNPTHSIELILLLMIMRIPPSPPLYHETPSDGSNDYIKRGVSPPLLSNLPRYPPLIQRLSCAGPAGTATSASASVQ
jgi:hypothetical protein